MINYIFMLHILNIWRNTSNVQRDSVLSGEKSWKYDAQQSISNEFQGV